MPTLVQDLVDELAAHLGRSVAVDDPGLRLIAHSTHYGDEDPGRVQSLLTRTISGALRKHVEAQNISDLKDYAYLRSEPSVAMAARLCVPLRFSGTLYGYVWVIDDHTMTDPQIRETQRVSRQLAMILAERAAEQRNAEKAAAGDLLTLSTRSAGAREAVNALAAHFKVFSHHEW